MALVLSRFTGESLIIKDMSKENPEEIIIKPYAIDSGLIRLYIDAPRHYQIVRNEIAESTEADGKKTKTHGGNTNENQS